MKKLFLILILAIGPLSLWAMDTSWSSTNPSDSLGSPDAEITSNPSENPKSETILKAQQRVIKDYQVSDAIELYEKILDSGSRWPMMDAKYKVSENLVPCCSTHVWMLAEKDAQGNVIYTAESDAIVLRA